MTGPESALRADPPRILVTLADPARSHRPDLATRKNERYLDAVRRSGGRPVPIDEQASDDERAASIASMDGLLLSGGVDLDPGMYGHPDRGAVDVQRGRDRLEQAAYADARARRLPVLGICRGLQAINVFEGGRLLQHVDGHQGPSYLEGEALVHELRLVAGTRLARVLLDGAAPGAGGAGAALTVNSYHHQAVREDDLAPGLRAAGTSGFAGGTLVEALESADPDRFLFAVQCHPERPESTPAEFERLFRAFVEAASARAGASPVARE